MISSFLGFISLSFAFVLHWYLMNWSDTDDALFFLRKNQFQKKLSTHAFADVLHFVEQLQHTKDSDWKITPSNEYKLALRPYPNTCVVLFGKSLTLYEGIDRTSVFYMEMTRDVVFYGENQKKTKRASLRDMVRMAHVLSDLNARSERILKQNALSSSDTTKTIPSQDTRRMTQEKVFSILESHLQRIVSKETPLTSNVCITDCVQDIKVNRYQKELDEAHSSIQQLLQQLTKDEDWLGIEARHQLGETFPNDLQALRNMYDLVQNKEAVHADTLQALAIIEQKLHMFANEIEQNKQMQLQKRIRIIEKR